MATVNTAELDAFRARVRAACESGKQQAFFEDCSREMAARLIAKAIKRTPVGVGTFEFSKGDDGTEKKTRLTNGGTLRRGWTSKTQSQAETGSGAGNATAFAKALPVTKAGNSYSIVVANPVNYASYVEYGHSQHVGQYVPAIGKRLVKPWVAGQFMLKKSVDELNGEAAAILQRKLDNYLKGLTDGSR